MEDTTVQTTRGPGRPRKTATEAQEPTAKERQAEAVGAAKPAKRRRRASVGGHALKLSAPARQGFTRRWVNDASNRVAEVGELGYEFVDEKGIQTSDPGSRVSRIVGTKANGEPLTAYLMETPDELYAEGVAEKEAHAAEIDDAIRAGRDHTGRMDEHSYGHGSIKVER